MSTRRNSISARTQSFGRTESCQIHGASMCSHRSSEWVMRRFLSLLAVGTLVSIVPAPSRARAGNEPAPSHLVGSVEDPRGRAVGDAGVALLPLNRAAAVVTTTDQQGRFEFHKVSPGTYRLSAEAPGFTTVTAGVTLVAGQTGHADLQ